jgi:Mrp family chromosome partitioning ATPase
LLVDARSAPYEQLAPLVDRILQTHGPEAPTRSLLFTTIDPEPQTIPVCATTADVLAGRTTKSVCIVDGHLRSPVLDRSFGLVSARGLSDLLLDGGDARLCITKVTSNLWLMPAGSRCIDALPCLAAEQIQQQLAQLLTLFDYVLLDTAPACLHNDAFVLGPCVDGVVLVINANATRREVAKRTAETLHAVNARLFGAVLTNRSFPIPEGIYRRL